MAQPEIAVVALQPRQQLLCHPFLLQTQRHHRIRAGQGTLQTPLHPHRSPLWNRIRRLPRRRSLHELTEGIRHQTRRAAEHHISTAGGEGPEIGAGHPGVQDVADNHDPSPLQRFRHRMLRCEVTGQGVQIQQSLAGMAVQAIAAVQHNRALPSRLQILGQLLGHPSGAMPDHQHICAHGHIGAGSIQHAFPLAQRAAGGRKALHIG